MCRWIFMFAITFPFGALANPGALIVVGLAGNESDAQSLTAMAADTRQALVARGIPDASIHTLEGARKPDIIAAFERASTEVTEDFWLVFFGHSSTGREAMPQFQVPGPRLTAEEISQHLTSIQARKWVFIGTSRSGEFLPFLEQPGVTALAATSGTGEIQQPRFPAHWTECFLQNPKAAFEEIATCADELVTSAYTSSSLARSEHPRLLNGNTGEILRAPFSESIASINTAEGPDSGKTPAITAADIEIPRTTTQNPFEFAPATPETTALIAEASAIPNPDQHAALLLRSDHDLTINNDHSSVERRALRVFLHSPASFDQWANYSFSRNPPVNITTILGARIMLPDGSSYILNTSQPEASSAPIAAPSSILFPKVEPGSVVEISWETARRSEMTLPAFYQEIILHQSIPVILSHLTIRTPKALNFQCTLQNSPLEAETSETAHSQVHSWQFENLAAHEPLPLEPPPREHLTWVGVSSFDSWDVFTDWFRRISEGAFESGPEVKQHAELIANAHPDRDERIRAAFELVASLRYVAIHIGIGAFRPRTPETVLAQRYGDCKDKANLLIALLREMDIAAHFVLINRGDYTDADFPGWQFNHAIAYLPDDNGGLWLDSTETTTPYGYVAPGNVGRHALVITEDAATFQRVEAGIGTTILDDWQLAAQPDGTWHGEFSRKLTGMAQISFAHHFTGLSPRQRNFAIAEFLQSLSPSADYEITPAEHNGSPGIHASATSPAAISPSHGLDFASAFSPASRTVPLELNDAQPFRYDQRIRFADPSGNPAPDSFHATPAGMRFSIEFSRPDANTLERHAILEITQPRISPEEYPQIREAFRQWSHQLQTSHAQHSSSHE